MHLGLAGVAPSGLYLLLFGGLVFAARRWSSHGSVRLVLSINAMVFESHPPELEANAFGHTPFLDGNRRFLVAVRRELQP